MAETGQVETQAPQSMHVPSSTPAFPSSCNAMAPTGQTPAHAPQPMHVSLSTFAGIVSSSFMLPIISWLLFFNNKFYRRSLLTVDHDIHKRRHAEQLQTDRATNPRAIATALIAWLIAPAPIVSTSTRSFSFNKLANAPATEFGLDFVDTFNISIKYPFLLTGYVRKKGFMLWSDLNPLNVGSPACRFVDFRPHPA